jgi:uncharacterized protein YecT (DUF1311 family)
MARLSPADQAKLRDAERTWLKTTKKTCDRAGGEDSQFTLGPVEVDTCYLNETAKRADFLKSFRP